MPAPEVADVLEVPATESDRRLLASILLKEDEELTAEVLEAAVRALRRIHLRRRQEEVQQELKKPGARRATRRTASARSLLDRTGATSSARFARSRPGRQSGPLKRSRWKRRKLLETKRLPRTI